MKNVIQIGQTVEIMAVNDFQSLKYSIGNTFKVKAIADVGSDNSLYVSEDYLTWFHPIDLKVIDDTTDHLWDDYKEALLPKNFLTKEMSDDRAFIVAAVSEELIQLIKEKHNDWLEESGYAAYYDLVIEIVDEMMFSENSKYLEFLNAKKKDKNLCFSSFANECFDWYHMGLAKKLVTEQLLHEVCFGNSKEYFDKIRVQKFYELGVDEGDSGTRTLKTFDTKEQADEKMKELQEMFPKMKLFVDTCTYDHLKGA